MRVLLTGATSFTGAHIARALVDAGHEVTASLTGRLVNYSDLLVQRRRELAKVSDWVEEAPFGSPNLLAALQKKKFDVFINHGADIRGYRKADFDYLASVRTGLQGARETMDALAASGCRLFLHSGSIFEPGEGEWDAGRMAASDFKRAPADAISIYGVSKSMVWEPLRFFAHRAGLNVSKVIIPN
ncbi:MAG: NAD(P)-dependent oxidoreductase, partial [Bdellovibrionales bacterium]|nr:NAD(P)-dependent oxidoreductase [Bdellovibrionales bacterium]